MLVFLIFLSGINVRALIDFEDVEIEMFIEKKVKAKHFKEAVLRGAFKLLQLEIVRQHHAIQTQHNLTSSMNFFSFDRITDRIRFSTSLQTFSSVFDPKLFRNELKPSLYV